MHTMRLISLLAMVAALSLGLATPIDQDPTLVAERSTSVDNLPANLEAAEFNFPANFDMQAYQDDIAELDHSFVHANLANESLVEKRIPNEDKVFQIYRMKKSSPHHDNFYIDSACNGGRCNANYFTPTSPSSNLCDREFTACNIKYKLKYTGKQGSCMKFIWFEDKGQQNGVKYAHLTRNGDLVGECLVWNNVRISRYCSAISNGWKMESALQCFIHR